MPLDGSTTLEPKIYPATLRGRHALAYLAVALREPTPTGFTWSFGNWLRGTPSCGFAGCAIGLAAIRGIAGLTPKLVFKLQNLGDPVTNEYMINKLSKRFGLDRSTFRRLFSPSMAYAPTITPDHVADAIDEYLATGIVDYTMMLWDEMRALT